jgi:hypothetical protein
MRHRFSVKKSAYILWLINPLASLYYSLHHIRNPRVFPAFLLFSFFFGLTFVLPSEQQVAADSARYAAELRILSQQSHSFQEVTDYLYSSESGKIDLYQPILTWLVSNFTDNPQWLFAIFGLVFGWFWFKNIQLLVNFLPAKLGWGFILLLFLFALINPIWGINGVRMWTAAQVFVYGTLLIFLQSKKNGYYYCITSLFVHFSFALPLVVLLAYQFVPKHTRLFFVGYIFSFFISELNIELIQQYFELLPDFLQTRRTYISNEAFDLLQERQASDGGLSWHVLLSKKVQQYFFLFSAIVIFGELMWKKRKVAQQFIKLFDFALAFAVFSNLAANVPSGGRFQVVAHMLMAAAISLFYKDMLRYRASYYRSYLKLSLPFLLFLLVFKVRVGFDYIGVVMAFGNPFIAVIVRDDIPLIDFIKSIL